MDIVVPDALLLILCFGGCLCFFRLPVLKLLYMHLVSAALLSIGGLIFDLVESMVHPEAHSAAFPLWGITAQYALSLLAAAAVFLLRRRVHWLMENTNAPWLWRLVWLVPFATTLLNILMRPVDYHTMHVGRVFEVAVEIEVMVVLFFCAFNFLLYYFAQSSYEAYLLRAEKVLYQLQVQHYETMQNYIREAARMRHDLKHVNATARSLLQSGEYQKLSAYLDAYAAEEFREERSVLYCENSVINAVLNHYIEQARQEGIRVSCRAEVPAETSISDVDLTIVLGNLMDNGIHGCETAPREERYMNIQIDRSTPGSLFITVCNSFDGHPGRKRGGEGIGQKSIDLIAKKYRGASQFMTQGREYQSCVMLRMEEEKRRKEHEIRRERV